MFGLVTSILISVLGCLLAAFISTPRQLWKLGFTKLRTAFPKSWFFGSFEADTRTTDDGELQDIHNLAECHETAALLADLIHKDGAGEWPPRSNHDHTTWPAVLRPYREVYEEMVPLLATANVSLDDEVNMARITDFRSRFRTLLQDRIDLDEVEILLKAAEAGQWDVFPRDTFNAFYCYIAWCRHAYR
jgi:hypothetical protein